MIYIIIFVLLIFGYMLGLYYWFQKADKEGWKAFVPYYRISTWVELTDAPRWFIWASFIPILNIFIYANLIGELMDTYRRYSFWEHSVAILFGWIWLPILGKSSKEQYYGPHGEKDGFKRPKKSKVREWVDAIIFALSAAYIIRTFIFEIYAIPTSSMEGTLRVGDVLVVSKFHYGSRVPNTPLSFPLVHHTFPKWLPILGGRKAYLEWIKLPYNRFPALQKINRNDMVVFNFPANDTTTKEYDSALPYYDIVRMEKQRGTPNPSQKVKNEFSIVVRPVDKRENYIKRCVAIPGDTLEVKKGTLFINNKVAFEPENLQHTYIVTTDGGTISKDEFTRVDITEFSPIKNVPNAYEIYTDKHKVEELKKFHQVKDVQSYTRNSSGEFKNSEYIYYPYHVDFKYNSDNYGPIVIPSKGMTIPLNKQNYLLYERCIRVYENNSIEVKNGTAYINSKPATEYTFKMNYYWMMGDNRHRSQDSRFWGFVPEDHIVGKAWFLITSYSKERSFLRLDRTFRSIHGSWAPKNDEYKQ